MRGLPRDEAQTRASARGTLTGGEISFDLTGRKSGRGAYVCRSQDCLQKAVRQHQLERAFSAPVSDVVRDALMAQLPDLPAPEDTDAADE